ncbi:MAG: hypothetical protein AAF757_26310 [Cyanobacteria bacterium P01_D01_bin.116]
MTQSVAEKTSIPEKTWRRQTDSPTWWIAFSCGSVILHLLAFWLINLYKLSAPQSGLTSAVAIEFIEISPQKPLEAKPKAKPKPKPILPKPANTTPKQAAKPIVPQNSQPAANPSVVKPPVVANDRDAIAFNNNQENFNSEFNTGLIPIPSLQPTPTPTPTPESTPTPAVTTQEPTPTPESTPESTPPAVTTQEPTPTPESTPESTPEPTPPAATTLTPTPTPTPTPEPTPTPAATTPKPTTTPTLPQSLPSLKKGNSVTVTDEETLPDIKNPSPGKGIFTAIWEVEADEYQQKQDTITPTGGNRAKPKTSVRERELDLSSLNTEISQPLDFQASLLIDSSGNFEDVWINPAIKEPERSQYYQYARKIFQDVKFQPAQNSDGTKPPTSNLVVRIKIKPSS